MKTTCLVAIGLIFIPASLADSTIYKCSANTKTVYSESPCGMNTRTSKHMGNETFDRETIEAARARIRADMNKHEALYPSAT
jgi:hypothetical protein